MFFIMYFIMSFTERGLRVVIAYGYDYYEPRLQEALEGQGHVRAFLSSGKYEL